MGGAWMVGIWLQDAGSLSAENTKWLMIFVGLVAFAMLVVAAVVVVLGAVAFKTQKKLLGIVDELKAKAMPIIASTQTIMADIVPKAKVISENVVETSHMVRNKVQEFQVTLGEVNTTVSEANQKTRAQVSRVDGMVTTILSRTEAIADSIHHSIQTPVKQVAGVVTGFKTGIEALVAGKGFVGFKRGY